MPKTQTATFTVLTHFNDVKMSQTAIVPKLRTVNFKSLKLQNVRTGTVLFYYGEFQIYTAKVCDVYMLFNIRAKKTSGWASYLS